MDDDVVADFQVVAKRELNIVEGFEVLSASLEDVARQQPAQLHAEPHVLTAGRGAVERIPQPEQRLYTLKALLIAVGVILGLERDVARVHRRQRKSRRRGQSRVADRGVPVSGMLRVPELGENIAA